MIETWAYCDVCEQRVLQTALVSWRGYALCPACDAADGSAGTEAAPAEDVPWNEETPP